MKAPMATSKVMGMELDLTTPEGRKQQGALILQAIKEAGLSVEQVAKDIGCSRALLYQYIAGTTLAQPDKLTLIAKRTGKPLAFFFGVDLTTSKAPTGEPQERPTAELLQVPSGDWERRLQERLEGLFALAQAQASPPDWRAAVATYEQALLLARELNDQHKEATILFRLGNLRLLMGDLEGALEVLHRAHRLFEQDGNLPYALACRQSIGRALLLLGRPEEARKQFLVAWQQGNWHNRWEAAVALAAVAEWMGDFQLAMQHLDEAEELAESAPSERDREIVHLFVAANRANVYYACGDFAEAEKLAMAALRIAERLGDRDQQLEALLTIAACQRFQGKWLKAYETAMRVRELASFSGDQEREVIVETLLAHTLAVSGDFAGAKQWAKSALTKALRLRSRRAELWAHKALAETYLREEDAEDALYHAQAAVELAEAMHCPLELAHTLCLLAWFDLQLGQLASAARRANQAFSLADDRGMRHIAAFAAWLLAQIAHEQSDQDATEWLSRAETLAHEVGDADLLSRCLALKGAWLLDSDPKGAEQALTEFHRLLENWRQEWREAGHEDSWLEDPLRFRTYLALANLIARQKGLGNAQEFVDSLGWLPLSEAWKQNQLLR